MKCRKCYKEFVPGDLLAPDGIGYIHLDCDNIATMREIEKEVKEKSELETLRSENELLKERVKELEGLNTFIKLSGIIKENKALKHTTSVLNSDCDKLTVKNIELNKRVNELEIIDSLWVDDYRRLNLEFIALKESKTVYVRRCGK